MEWQDYPATTTPITAAELNRIERNLTKALADASNALARLPVDAARNVVVGDPTSTAERYYRLYRKAANGDEQQGLVYLSTNDTPSLALATRTPAGLASALTLRATGQISVQTGPASSTPDATRPLPFATAAGYVESGDLAAGESRAITLTFPAGRFTTAPVVMITPASSRHVVGVASISKDSCVVTLRNTAASPGEASFRYIALQATI